MSVIVEHEGISGNSLKSGIYRSPTLRVGEILNKTAAAQKRPTTSAFKKEVTGGAHDCVVLSGDVPEDGLKAGDIGTVVPVHEGGAGSEMEFITLTRFDSKFALVEMARHARNDTD